MDEAGYRGPSLDTLLTEQASEIGVCGWIRTISALNDAWLTIDGCALGEVLTPLRADPHSGRSRHFNRVEHPSCGVGDSDTAMGNGFPRA